MYNTYKLKNGFSLVYEKMPFVKTVSVGIWVRAGSMYETKKENGISHFIEHMLFKGTKRRSAYKIAEEMDFVGGHMNAYTSRECTCYYTKTLSESLELSVDMLSDMYYNSLFAEEDIEVERKVIIEEINMYEDSPEDVSIDGLTEYIWENNPLGYQIAGSIETVGKITREMMLDYMSRRYTPENTVISVAGSFDEKELIALCEKYFSGGENVFSESLTPPQFIPCRKVKEKDIEQTHLSIAYPGFKLCDDSVYEITLLNNILGASMSSRLFQSIREKYGLCYSIYSYTASFPQAGMIGIYAGLNSDEAEKAEKLIQEETDRLCTEKISSYELEKARSQIRCSLIMNRESVSSKMSENGKAMLLLGRIRSEEETLERINSISRAGLLQCAQKVFAPENKAVFILKNQR